MNERKTAMRRLPWILLVLSLAVNGFFVGAVATGFVFDRETRRGGMLSSEWRMLTDGLPDEYRERLRAGLQGDRDAVRDDFRRLRELRGEIRTMLAAPEPDRAAIDQRLVEIRAITARLQERGQERILDIVIAFPPEARAGIAAQHDNR